MVGGRTERTSRRHTPAASVVVPFPCGAAGDRLHLARIVPSGRFLLAAFAIVGGTAAAYWGALSSSVFAVDRIEVRGAPREVVRDVLAATESARGQSLVALDAGAVEATVRALPSVAGVTVDRAFPNTLVVRVAPERPVAVARKRRSSWLVTGSGKVIREIRTGSQRVFPRLWLTRGVTVRVGGMLPATFIPATKALAAARDEKLPRRVKAVRATDGELTLVLRRGPEIRLGAATDLGLKVAVARAVFSHVDRHRTYIDVSVPERPVAGY